MKNLSNLGFYRVAVASPLVHLAQPRKNAQEILRLAKKAHKDQSLILLTPELSLTGYSCEDLFHTQDLIEQSREALIYLAGQTKTVNCLLIVGVPWQTSSGHLYNCAAVLFKGQVLGLVPKTHLPNYGEFYEKRWFSSGQEVDQKVEIDGHSVLMSSKQLFRINQEVILGIEICEDLWSPLPPSVNLALRGANLILNLSATNELVAKTEYRRQLVSQQSARLNCAYLYASASSQESTKDVVFASHNLISENGNVLKENLSFSLDDNNYLSTEIDLNKIQVERRKNTTWSNSKALTGVNTQDLKMDYKLSSLSRNYNPHPFIPAPNVLSARCQEILEIQSTGLARRLRSINNKSKLVLGLSGGLDSTLALLVGLDALKKINQPSKNLMAISMPGFGTSERTKNQAQKLAHVSDVNFKEIDITNAVRAHFKAIGHDEDQTDSVFENAQARERTQVLFNLANKHQAIVLGTGDLSELALGWCTFNGDQMSNYNVNASVPKTLVKILVKYYAEHHASEALKEALMAVLGTVISPELLPLDKVGNIRQSTEDLIGPYELHDFFLFHLLRNGFSKEKILFLAQKTFKDNYSKQEVKKWHGEFFARFFKNQFKRTTLPPGPKVGSVSLSPRGDWRMPDEIK